MKLVLHIVRKDFRRLRLGLVLLALAPLAKVIIGFLARSGHFSAAQPSEEKQWYLVIATLTWGQAILTFFLAVWLVQEDPLVGTRPFWLTRPIARGRLLAAKFASVVLLLGGVPVLVCLPWWTACHFGVTDFAWAILETVMLQLAIALPAVLVAALTDTIQRVLLWTMVLVVAAAATIAIWSLLVAHRLGENNFELAWARTWMPMAVLLVGALATIAIQFLRRRWWRGVSILLGSILLAAAIATAWPASWVAKTTVRELNPERAAGVTLEFDGASVGDRRYETSAHVNPVMVDLIVRHIPTNRWLSGTVDRTGVDDLSESWRWPTGLALERGGWLTWGGGSDNWGGQWHDVRDALHLRDPQPDPETTAAELEAWQKTRVAVAARRMRLGQPPLPERPWWPPSKPGDPGLAKFSEVAYVPLSFIARMQLEPSVYEGVVWFELLRANVRLKVPMRAGGWYHDGGHGLRIMQTGITRETRQNWHYSDSAMVKLVETWSTMFSDDWNLIHPSRGRRPDRRDFARLYAVNPGRGEMVEANGGSAGGLRIASALVTWRTVHFPIPKISRHGQWVDVQPPWTENAALAVVGYDEDARFERRIEVDKFLIGK